MLIKGRVLGPFCSRLLLSGLVFLSLLSACLKSSLGPEEDGSPLGTVWKLNKNVTGLRGLANACMNADSVALFNIEYNDDGSVLYWLSMKMGGDIDLYSEIVSQEICVPELSMQKVGGSFYWMVNGIFLTDSNGEQISVTDVTKPISFLLHDKSICCRVKNSVVAEFPFTKADYLAKDVAIDYDMDNRGFNIRLASGFKSILPAISEFHLIDSSVKNRSFYKDVFLDAGIALTSRKSLAAAEYLRLSLEGVSLPYSKATASDKSIQSSIVSGDSLDSNGRLLYPDGQPRFRLLFVNGGNSTSHGQSLGKKGMDNMRAFVENGGSYVGTCAGAFFASNGYDGKVDYPYYLSLWPGMMQHSGLRNVTTGMFIEKNSPLLQYYDFGEDFYVEGIRHNEGGYPVSFPLRTEILARYDYQQDGKVHRKPSIWAYKPSWKSGRIIMEGSHPEEVSDGERRDLTAAMMLYALDGVGTVSIKGYLQNGKVREMDKKTEDNDPDYTRIGDLQTHHFAAYIPSEAKNVIVQVNCSSDCDFALMMSQGTYAFTDTADYMSSGSETLRLSFSSLPEGFWFIGVKCLTTVTVEETDYGQAYKGHTEVLNGIPYSISISWE